MLSLSKKSRALRKQRPLKKFARGYSSGSATYFYEETERAGTLYNGHEIISWLNEITNQFSKFVNLEITLPKMFHFLSKINPMIGVTVAYKNRDQNFVTNWHHPDTDPSVIARSIENSYQVLKYFTHSDPNGSVLHPGELEQDVAHYKLPYLVKVDKDSAGHRIVLPLNAMNSGVFGVLQIECIDEVSKIVLSLVNALVNQLAVAMDRVLILENQEQILRNEQAALLQARTSQKQKEDAILANNAKSDFLANMSHEIRTPLGVILGYSQLLAAPDTTDEERFGFYSTIEKNGILLTRLIDDILDLAKVEDGKITLEQIDFSLAAFMNDIFSTLSPKAYQKNIALNIDLSSITTDRIRTDPLRLKQILINIAGNAVKFTDRGSVTINAAIEQYQDREELIFRIMDTGRGITELEREHLFQPFMQADNSTTRKYGGTGLGLILSRHLANALGGNVVLEWSNFDIGSTFVVRIKIETIGDAGAPSEIKKTELEGNLLHGKSMLVVDDAPDNLMLFTIMLESQGARVETARNGSEAVEKATLNNYDAVLMDLQMPLLDGFMATSELRRRGFKKPILAITALAMKEERERAFVAGCNDHLAKPVNAIELVDKLYHLVDSHHVH